MSDDGLVERVALELAEAHDTDRGRGDSPAADAYRAGSCAVGYWNALASAAIEAAGVTALTNQVAVLREVLTPFANAANSLGEVWPDGNLVCQHVNVAPLLTFGDLRKARQAFSDVTTPKEDSRG